MVIELILTILQLLQMEIEYASYAIIDVCFAMDLQVFNVNFVEHHQVHSPILGQSFINGNFLIALEM